MGYRKISGQFAAAGAFLAALLALSVPQALPHEQDSQND